MIVVTSVYKGIQLCDKHFLLVGKFVFIVVFFSMSLILIKIVYKVNWLIYSAVSLKDCKSLKGRSNVSIIFDHPWLGIGTENIK